VAIPPGLPPVLGDEVSVELALRNLVSNALKYGPPGGTVTIAASAARDGVEVRVADEGPGIPAEDRARIFDLFYRVPRSRTVAPGAGIGLFVVRALVEAMGGTVRAGGEPGRGAEVALWLPAYSMTAAELSVEG
jgi:two-component system, OmpR family, sensor histidine kinase KdpD